MAKVKKPTEKEFLKELEAFKKAKQENDERFMRERDEARAEVEVLRKANSKLVDELTETGNQRAALTKEADDAASRIVELHAMLQQKLSPTETCREERAEGNGGCGTCTICCNELKAELFETKATMQKEAAQWKADYECACKLVADMHAAAVGEVRGPSVGPVEDVAAVRAQLLAIQVQTKGATVYDGVLKEIQEERTRQDSKGGEQNHPDGTGHPSARSQADAAKSICNHFAKVGQLTWMQILTEEMLEAFAETNQEKLRTELIQSAAVATAWAECIDRRKHGGKG